MKATSAVSSIDGGKTPEQLCTERARRIKDACQLKQPDRIPTILRFGHLTADLAGITRQEMYENPAAEQKATEDAALRFRPDMVMGGLGTPAVSRALGDRSTKWPGYGLGANGSFQYHEAEFMKAEEYDAFLDDPVDWAIRTYLPRVFGALEGLTMLPPLGNLLLGRAGLGEYLALIANPQVASAFQALSSAAQAQVEFIGNTMASMQRLAEAGFPPAPFFSGATLLAPFDFIGDTLRGMRGIFLDLRRCPDKLLAAQEKVIPFIIEAALATCRAKNAPWAFIPLHRGSDGFMSIQLFERFYWPQLKRVMLSLIDAGVTPFVIWEGNWDQRLEYLAELPNGKTVGAFQSSDIFKVKEILGDVMCIQGGMPVSMLAFATPGEIRDHTRRVCEVAGKGGGFIMTTDIAEMEGCDPALIEVWMDATREFGVY
jgi:uroporphyrinogen-III decarboxylase